MPVMPVLESLGQEIQGFRVILSYKMKSGLPGLPETLSQKKNKKFCYQACCLYQFERLRPCYRLRAAEQSYVLVPACFPSTLHMCNQLL